MTILDDIKTATRQVIASGNLSELMDYRQRTSSPTTATATYGSWTAVYGLLTGARYEESFSTDRDTLMRMEVRSLRLSDTGPALKHGDQIRDPSSVVWAVDAQESGAAGTRRFRLIRDVPNKQTPQRNGGLV